MNLYVVRSSWHCWGKGLCKSWWHNV